MIFVETCITYSQGIGPGAMHQAGTAGSHGRTTISTTRVWDLRQ